MRQRKLIPDTHTQWLKAYLQRTGLKGYPNELTREEWKRLQGAYRQVLLKEAKPLNNANESKQLLERNMELVAELAAARKELKVKPTAAEVQGLKAKIEELEESLDDMNEENDGLRLELHQMLELNNTLKKNIESLNKLYQTAEKATSPSYDGKELLPPFIAELIGCSPKSSKPISKATTDAKAALGITNRKMTKGERVKVYEYIKALNNTLV